MTKYSRQREAIKEYLKTRVDHPTAEAVYLEVRQTNPKISLGTVYRNLALLSSSGEISKISCGDGVERYDANVLPHCHYHCNSCGEVKDVFIDTLPDIQSLAGNTIEDELEGYNIMFYGTCKTCAQKNNKDVYE